MAIVIRCLKPYFLNNSICLQSLAALDFNDMKPLDWNTVCSRRDILSLKCLKVLKCLKKMYFVILVVLLLPAYTAPKYYGISKIWFKYTQQDVTNKRVYFIRHPLGAPWGRKRLYCNSLRCSNVTIVMIWLSNLLQLITTLIISLIN